MNLHLNELYYQKKLQTLTLRKNFSSHFKPGITIITPTNKPDFMKNIRKNFTRCSYPKVEFIIILNSDLLNIEMYKRYFSGIPNIKIYKLGKNTSLGESLNFGIEHSNYNYVAKLDDDDYYGKNYIEDAMNIFNYTNADIVGKSSHFIYFEKNKFLNLWHSDHDNQYAKAVAGATFVMKKYIFKKVKFHNLTNGEDLDLLRKCNSLGFRIYSGDIFNYVYNRHIDIQNHSWKINNSDLISKSKYITTTGSYHSLVCI
ncbi:glycosyltransferase [Clostridium felsineum]|uniref:glycosyltransferase n=1 Tax=Clostridium felsineum TaxID=36839 RepID=UPI00214D9A32|nr:glycosyltransferase [Clostridium felsineum]MCR3761172.1 glycosyltransferase [Clostridium felsineum]